MCYTDSYIKRDDTPDGLLEGSLPKTLRMIEYSLADLWDSFDVILVSGLSGVIPGAIIAHKYGKQLVVVRKDDDITHGERTEGLDYWAPGTPYIVLDDMVSTGNTLMRMFNKAIEHGHGPPKYFVMYRGKTIWTDTPEHWGGYRIDFQDVREGLYSVTVTRERVA